MRLRHRTTISGIVIALALIAAACGSSSTENVEEVEQAEADNALATVSGDPESEEREADAAPANGDETSEVEQEAEQSVADSDPAEAQDDADGVNADDEALGYQPTRPAADSADQSEEEPDPEAESESAARFVSLGGDRPARLRLPASYDDATPLPLVMLLHGYTSTSAAQDGYFGLSERADADGFLLILPEGRRDSTGQQFWNATDACCDLFGAGGDDSSYLTGLIEETLQRFAVDGERVWVIGHSNGGFMSYRLACDGAPINAIVSLAGSEFADEAICDDAPPLHVLQIHGDLDPVISYDGAASLGPGLGGFPSAPDVVERWARRAGCRIIAEDGGVRDLDRLLPGAETEVTEYAQECAEGASAELWSIRGGGHVPPLVSDFAEQVVGWLMSR